VPSSGYRRSGADVCRTRRNKSPQRQHPAPQRHTSLAAQFAEVRDALLEATRSHDKVRAAYFLDRRRRAQAGEELEQLVCHDSDAWQTQLRREGIARENGEADRKAGLVV
jgi:hypothetical protein